MLKEFKTPKKQLFSQNFIPNQRHFIEQPILGD